MATPWSDIPIKAKHYSNVDEIALTQAQAALENAYITEADGYSRFPWLDEFVDLGGKSRIYLHDWHGDLIAATSDGKLYRIDDDANASQIGGVPITGGRRVTFTKTDTDLCMAAGGPIIAFDGDDARILSEDAPLTTHVQFIDTFLVAIERDSGRFHHAAAGDYDSWNPLDVFSANGKPDNITAAIVTDFRELLLGGPDSIEQFERITSGSTPFFRRWSVGEGIFSPYLLVAADNGAWGVNRELEFVRFSGQTSEPRSLDVGRTLENIDDWRDAWIGGYPNRPLNVSGQKFLVFQAPFATTPYGTKGLTLCYDYRNGRWSTLYGWDSSLGAPTRWPGWSHWRKEGDKAQYVGGEGKIYKLNDQDFANAGGVQRMYGRTAHLSEMGEIRIDNLRARFKRGAGSNTSAGTFNIRAIRDNGRPTNWVRKSFGFAGDRSPYVEFGPMGCAHTWQFEWFITDNCTVEFTKLEAQATKLGM